MKEYPGGSKRSESMPDYASIPGCALRRLAKRYSLGASVYGIDNWKKSLSNSEGFAAGTFAREAYNHMMEHMTKMIDGVSPEDDHLAAIAWGCFALMYTEYMHPDVTSWIGLRIDTTPRGEKK